MENHDDMKMKLQLLVEDLDLIEDELSKWINPTNIFSILKLSRNEIRHSNFLSYLFDPKESHGYDDNFIKDFLKLCVTDKMEEQLAISYFGVALSDYSDMFIYREKANIDLLLVSEKNKLVVCIENKIDASESAHQLKKYQEYVETTYKGYDHLLVFLTPNGIEPSKEEWKIVSYDDVMRILERRQSLKRVGSKVDVLINDYIDMLRRDILMDEELQKICQRIYKEHKDALDLIFDNRPDNLSVMSELYIEALTELAEEGKVIFDPTLSGKTYIHFELKELTNIFPTLPEDELGTWGNHKQYLFEIHNRDEMNIGNIRLVFVGQKITSDRRKELETFFEMNGQSKPKPNWKYRTLKSWRIDCDYPNFVDYCIVNVEDGNRSVIVNELKNILERTIGKINNTVKEYVRIKNEL